MGEKCVCPSPCWTVCGGLQRGWAASREQTSDASEHSVKHTQKHNSQSAKHQHNLLGTLQKNILNSYWKWYIINMINTNNNTESNTNTNLRLKFSMQLWEQSSVCFSPLLQHCNSIKTKICQLGCLDVKMPHATAGGKCCMTNGISAAVFVSITGVNPFMSELA